MLKSSYPAYTHLVVHVSDTHLVGDGKSLYGEIDCDAHLNTLLGQIALLRPAPSAILFTGDLADDGKPDAYKRLRKAVFEVAELKGIPVMWLMGNHDDRSAFRTHLLDEPSSTDPIDQVFYVDGLRVIALDTTVPGQHYGELTETQCIWLEEQLAVSAPQGTLLAMHHPPLPSPLGLMALVELRNHQRIVDILQGTDVRGILAGHLHYSTSATLRGGIPVSVAAASCYTQDLKAPFPGVRAQNSGQSFNLVHVYPEYVVSSVVSLRQGPTLYQVSDDKLEAFLRLNISQQIEALNHTA